jgi:hypothetical protein
MLAPNPLSEPPQQPLPFSAQALGNQQLSPIKERKFNMTNKRDNRVLGRIGARELSDQETEMVQGGFVTLAPCSAPSPTHPNGDGVPADCGGV